MISPSTAALTALSWLTVFPVRTPSEAPDRNLGGAVIASVPAIGAALGALSAAIAFGLSWTALPPLMIGGLVIAVLAAATRGMHLDGLSDTADGLGCYGSPERVAEVMRSGSAGPFGVATLIVVLGIQWTGFTALTVEGRWYELAFAIAVGRVGAVVGCRRGLGSATPSGFGPLVAGTQRTSIGVWAMIAAVMGVLIVESPIRAIIVVAAVVAVAWMFTAHCARRMGGINGDVLGAVIEIGVAIAVVGLLV